jgi:hypothetical protein
MVEGATWSIQASGPKAAIAHSSLAAPLEQARLQPTSRQFSKSLTVQPLFFIASDKNLAIDAPCGWSNSESGAAGPAKVALSEIGTCFLSLHNPAVRVSQPQVS